MQTLRQQTAVIVAGAPGAGKSTLAVVVARALAAAFLDNDAAVGTIDPLLAGRARDAARASAYEALLQQALAVARSGCHVVVAAPFTRERSDPDAWQSLRERFAEAGADAVLAWIRVPDAVLIERLSVRDAGRDSVKLADPDGWLREANPGRAPSAPHIEVDGTRSVDAAVGALLAALAARENSEACQANVSPAGCAS